jgi:leucyl aminopeptidase
MEQMKTDMSGAAAVIATMSTLGRLGITAEVHAFMPVTDNMVSGRSIRPGDVLKHYGGATTEVTNTDAEGRLILADTLVFAGEQDFDAIVDIATLTGSMTIALGRKGAGFFSNDDTLMEEIKDAARNANELFWPMPLWPEYQAELDSPIADRKNVGSRYGGAITAALFLQSFVPSGTPWAHLDIAGPARSESDFDEITRGGTAFGVRTLIGWVQARGS